MMMNIFTEEIKNTRFILTVMALGLLAFFGLAIIYLIETNNKTNPIPEGLMGLLTTLLGAVIAIVSVAYNSHFKAQADAATVRAAVAVAAAAKTEKENPVIIIPATQDALACNDKGIALSAQGKHEEAVKAYDEAIRLDPSNAFAWYNKGSALKALNRTTEADAAFATAKSLGYVA